MNSTLKNECIWMVGACTICQNSRETCMDAYKSQKRVRTALATLFMTVFCFKSNTYNTQNYFYLYFTSQPKSKKHPLKSFTKQSLSCFKLADQSVKNI